MTSRYNKHSDIGIVPWRMNVLNGCTSRRLIDGILPKNGPIRHAYAWQIGPFWQDTLVMYLTELFGFEFPRSHMPSMNFSGSNIDEEESASVLFPVRSFTELCGHARNDGLHSSTAVVGCHSDTETDRPISNTNSNVLLTDRRSADLL